MELELGLAPAAHFVDRKCFDLNENAAFEKYEVMREQMTMKKRSFDEAFENRGGTGRSQTLALLQWSRQPNEEDDRNAADRLRNCQVDQRDVEEKGLLVGWPPIRSWRKRQLHNHQGGGWVAVTNERIVANGGRNSTFVKVKMEGVAIGRKIDLSLYNSYQVLTNNLINMFSRYQDQECGKNGGGYALLYQDKQGNWLVAGDVPWMTFVGTVHRIEILRSGD
nr:auxin-responsive protein IAA29 [Ipomoea batatas]